MMPDTITTAGDLADTTRELRLWVRLLSCAKVIEKRLRRNFQEQFATTLPRFDVLAALDRAAKGLPMGALSQALLVSNGNVTVVVRQLEEQGLVASRADPADGRSAIVSLTAQGQEHFAALASAHRGWVHEALKDIAPEHQEQLLALLGQLKAVLE